MPNITATKEVKIFFGSDYQGFYWPDSEQKRSEVLSVKRNAPADFEAVYQGRPGAREGVVFLSEDLNAFYSLQIDGVPFPVTDFQLGIQAPHIRKFISKGHSLCQAWDSAFSTTTSSAWTVCATGLFVPCQSYHCGEDPEKLGPCEFHFDVLLLDIFRRRLDFADLIPEVKGKYQLWAPNEVVIEKKASGIDIIASLKNAGGIPIIPTVPQEGKRQRAINSVGLKTAGSVQGWFRQHRVMTPTYAPWLEKWRTEMKDFSGADDTSSDQVDATVHLVTRAIIMGSSMMVLPADWTPDRAEVPGYLMPSTHLPIGPDPRGLLLSVIGELPSYVEDPYEGTCARCINKGDKQVCPVTKRKMLALDSCESYSDSIPVDLNAIADSFRERVR